MKKTFVCTALLATTALVAGAAISPAFGEEGADKMTELEATQAYDKAANDFAKTLQEAERKTETYEENTAMDDSMSGEAMSEQVFGDVALVSDAAIESILNEPDAGYEPIAGIRLTVNAENDTLERIVDDIVEQAAPMAGVWDVKWRLEEESKFLLRERVNLTAETNFEQFMDYLTDRVNNMTGIKLYVTVFDASRIIIISDTYY